MLNQQRYRFDKAPLWCPALAAFCAAGRDFDLLSIYAYQDADSNFVHSGRSRTLSEAEGDGGTEEPAVRVHTRHIAPTSLTRHNQAPNMKSRTQRGPYPSITQI